MAANIKAVEDSNVLRTRLPTDAKKDVSLVPISHLPKAGNGPLQNR